MRRVILESPYRGITEMAIARNVTYARAAVRDCLLRDEAPLASHLLYTQRGVLRDEVPDERALGIAAGLAWAEHAEAMVVYVDNGISDGMQKAIEHAGALGLSIEYRRLNWR